MNWQAIGATGEILGALGVVVTLAYLTMNGFFNSYRNLFHQYLDGTFSDSHGRPGLWRPGR